MPFLSDGWQPKRAKLDENVADPVAKKEVTDGLAAEWPDTRAEAEARFAAGGFRGLVGHAASEGSGQHIGGAGCGHCWR